MWITGGDYSGARSASRATTESAAPGGALCENPPPLFLRPTSPSAHTRRLGCSGKRHRRCPSSAEMEITVSTTLDAVPLSFMLGRWPAHRRAGHDYHQ